MPPRIPVVAVFVACYLAATLGDGYEAVWRTVDLWNREIAASMLGFLGFEPPAQFSAVWEARLWTGRLWLSLGDALSLGAAVLALPDAAWRPARRRIDRALSVGAAAVCFAAMLLETGFVTPAFSVLTALAFGDAAAALGGFRGTRRAP